MEKNTDIERLLKQLPPISLEEMSEIRLMKRSDTKFLTQIETLKLLLQLVRDNYYVQQINGQRVSRYATTYWDHPLDHHFFRIHHSGHRPRMKVRVRTYVDSQQSFLEIKKKDNHGKTSKKRIVVPSLEAVIEKHYGEDFLKNRTGFTFDDLVPTLSNQFKRITLVNKNRTERLTIDYDLHFFNRETGQNEEMQNVVIIELKRDGRVVSPILPILRELRIKPAGFSKYCIGTAVTNKTIPQNLFKQKLVYIKKVAQKQTTAVPVEV